MFESPKLMKMGLKYSLLLASILLFLFLLPLLSHAEPFEFFKGLKGRKKGDKVKDIKQLKKYLNYFGYLKSPKDDDNFDDSLESAIKTYQLNYNLNVTGTLDSETVKQMRKPRCGVPDITNGTTSMRSGLNDDHRHLTEFHTVSHYSFFPGSPKWPRSKSRLTYAFHPRVNVNVMGPVCSRSFKRWADVSHFTFRRIRSYRNADIKISFERRGHGDGYPFDGRGGILAHAFAPKDGRFHYDNDERWVVGRVRGAFDLETVAMHEIGHLLGLRHSSVAGAIMYPTVASGTRKLRLHADDKAGIRALYRRR